MKEFSKKHSRRLLIIGGVILGIFFFIFQISETKKRINSEGFIFSPAEKIENIIQERGGKKEIIYKIYNEKKDEINENLTIETELIEELQKEINNEENGAEKE